MKNILKVERALEHLHSIYAAAVLHHFYKGGDMKRGKPLTVVEPHNYIKALLAEDMSYSRNTSEELFSSLLFHLIFVDWKRAVKYLH